MKIFLTNVLFLAELSRVVCECPALLGAQTPVQSGDFPSDSDPAK